MPFYFFLRAPITLLFVWKTPRYLLPRRRTLVPHIWFLFPVNDIPAAPGNRWHPPPTILYRSFPMSPAVYHYHRRDLRHVRETRRKSRLVLDEPPPAAGYRITLYSSRTGPACRVLHFVGTIVARARLVRKVPGLRPVFGPSDGCLNVFGFENDRENCVPILISSIYQHINHDYSPYQWCTCVRLNPCGCHSSPVYSITVRRIGWLIAVPTYIYRL